MGKCKRILKRIFCLPPLWTVIVSLFGYGFVIAVAAVKIQNPILQYASYTASAYALIVTVTGLVYIHTAIGGVRKFVSDHPLMKKFRSTVVGEKYLTDVRFRAGVSLYQGFFINLLYIVMKLVSGILYRSTWFIALAVYYILLAVMRFLLVRRLNVQDEVSELRRYRLCGVMLLFMNQALAGIVIFMVYQNQGFDYPGLLIYAMAAYAFYAVILAIVNVVKTRRHNSPILSAAKAINPERRKRVWTRRKRHSLIPIPQRSRRRLKISGKSMPLRRKRKSQWSSFAVWMPVRQRGLPSFH